LNPLPHGYQSGALVHSATQILAFQEWKLEFIKMFNDKSLLISADRSLLSCCTVLWYEIKPNFAKDRIKPPFVIFSAFLKKITTTGSSHFQSPNGHGLWLLTF
jgi:hypothetical protein